MKRYQAYDPPEYLDWQPDPDLVEGYKERLTSDPERARYVEGLDRDRLLRLYRDLLRTRLHDTALKRWVRTGVISKAWLGTGEEATTVGAVAALDPARDRVCPMIRNAGALHMMGMSLADMLKGYLATADSPSRGRDLHVGDLDLGVIQPISQMGTNVPVMAGVALGLEREGHGGVALTWAGDGATRTAAFHEGINFAATEGLPMALVIQNNQVALGTRLDAHGAGAIDRIPGAYGIPGLEADGNNVLDVLAAVALAVERCREARGPVAVVAETFRMGGHATHDEREARETFPADLFRYWGRRDPVGLYEEYLTGRGVARNEMQAVEEQVVAEMDRAAEEALAARHDLPAPEEALYEGFSEGGALVGLERRPV